MTRHTTNGDVRDDTCDDQEITRQVLWDNDEDIVRS